jgi:hypothetical protein
VRPAPPPPLPSIRLPRDAGTFTSTCRLDFDAVVVTAAPIVTHHPAHAALPAGGTGRAFTNVFVKNFRDDVTDEQFRATFAGCGNITSAVVARDAEGRSQPLAAVPES